MQHPDRTTSRETKLAEALADFILDRIHRIREMEAKEPPFMVKRVRAPKVVDNGLSQPLQ